MLLNSAKDILNFYGHKCKVASISKYSYSTSLCLCGIQLDLIPSAFTKGEEKDRRESELKTMLGSRYSNKQMEFKQQKKKKRTGGNRVKKWKGLMDWR